MVQRGARRRLVIGLTAALGVNAALLALLAPGGREVGWRTPTDTTIAVRLELTREPQRRAESVPATSAEGPRAPSTETSAQTQARSPTPATPKTQSLPAAPPAPPPAQAGRSGTVQSDSQADLRAKAALALRKMAACSRVNSGAGDAQDRELCTASAAVDDGPGLDTIPGGKRAEYDAAHAKAGYLVPADAANPNFVTSEFKRGGTVVKGHVGCSLVGAKWTCVGH